ncbi:MAG: hypothetical protein ACYS0I_07840 [Planctomycetota bacterium]
MSHAGWFAAYGACQRGADAKVRVTFLSRQEFEKLDLDTHEKMTENVGTYR